MIRCLGVSDREIKVEQKAFRPTVYLDNWALDLFSSDYNLGSRFSDLLNALKGTLTFSVINLLEILGRDDRKQVLDICKFIDSVDGVFISFDPSEVIRKEKEFRNEGNRGFSPCADNELLKTCILNANNFREPFKISELIKKTQEEIKNRKYVMEEKFDKDIYSKIEKIRKDKDALLKAKKRFQNKTKRLTTNFPHTDYLYKRCIDFIIINENMKMPNKEWRDLYHTIVPVAYCDFVLIDKRWTYFVNSVELKSPEIARVYSQEQLRTFLSDLKQFSN